MPTIPVAASAVKVSGTYASTYTLRNSGVNPLYVGNSPSVSATSMDMTLLQGATIHILPNQEVWVIATAALPTEAQFGEAASSITDGATVVTINGGVSIVGAVDVSGSAVTVNGTVDITSGTVDIGTIAGPVVISAGSVDIASPVALKSDLTLLGSASFAWTNGVGPQSGAGLFDISVEDYTSVLIVVDTGAAVGIATVETNYLQIAPRFQDISGAPTTREYIAQWLLLPLVTDGAFSLHLPVKGALLDIPSIDIGKAATAAGGTAVITVYGSHEPLERPKYVHGQLGTGVYPRDGEHGQRFTATLSSFISSENGGAVYTVSKAGTATAAGLMLLRYCRSGVFYPIHYQQIAGGDPVNQTKVITPIALPMMPINISYTLTGAGGIDVALVKSA